jgi:DNA-binding beta-propeller fold protein YncE
LKYPSFSHKTHKINGDKLWEFLDVARIREPNGVAIDRDLNVYVASRGNNSVVVISPDGKLCRTVLDESDGIAYPITPRGNVDIQISINSYAIWLSNSSYIQEFP